MCKALGIRFYFSGFSVLFLYLLSLSGTESKPSRCSDCIVFAFKKKEEEDEEEESHGGL